MKVVLRYADEHACRDFRSWIDSRPGGAGGDRADILAVALVAGADPAAGAGADGRADRDLCRAGARADQFLVGADWRADFCFLKKDLTPWQGSEILSQPLMSV